MIESTIHPKAHPSPGWRHNPDAWRDCTIPPTAALDKYTPAFSSWQTVDDPRQAMTIHIRRARGILSFVHFAFRQWGEAAFKQQTGDNPLPDMVFCLPDAQGLVEVLGAAGEALDLAENAADAVLQKSRDKDQSTPVLVPQSPFFQLDEQILKKLIDEAIKSERVREREPNAAG